MKGKFLTLGLAGMAIVSCSNHDFDFEQYAAEKHEAKIQQYTQAFINTFGTPAAGHTWGFGTTRAAVTRGANAGDGDLNNQKWRQFDTKGLANVTDAERQAVLAAIANKVTGEKISEDIVFPWENYFLQDVITMEDNNYTNAGKNGMQDVSVNYLEAFAKNENCGHSDGGNYVIVTNSKKMNQYFLQTANGGQDRISQTTLMTDMEYGTYEEMKGRQFRVWINCHINGHYDDYITVQVNGNWYVCFDFGCGDAAHDVDGQPGRGATYNDWDYNDWIIKITEGVPHGGEKTPVWGGSEEEGLFQVWCEDLGAEYGVNSNDFDFNDVVISFKKNTSGNTEMWLDAAGATLPIEIYWDETLLGEVHQLFEVNEKIMVNTGAGATVDAILLDTIDGVVTTADLSSKLQIKVQDGETGVWYTLENTGKAPQMIVCEYGLRWSPEFIKINDTFNPSFNNWVGRSNAGKFTGKE